MVANLASPDWDTGISLHEFDFILCFAVLHHIPSKILRLQFLKKVRALLAPEGRFVHSNWQFLNSEKLTNRIQSWEIIGLRDEMVDENDYLLDWRRGGEGLRYVHYFTNIELLSLATRTGFKISGMFVSDGASGNLALYHIWEPQ